MYNFIDLFCGCGGFSSGLEAAGHHCLLGVDYNPAAVESFRLNHPQAKALHMDIHKLSKAKLLKLLDGQAVDMVVGGPPCQGFSTVGKGDASDLRNSLFKQFIRVVKITDPKIIIFENVTGILAQKNEFVLKSIFKSFEKLGYNLEAQVMSADHYGVPSRRRRTIIMGVKKAHPIYPKPSAQRVSVAKALSSLKTRGGKLLNHDLKSAQLVNKDDLARLRHIPPGRGIRYQKDEQELLPKKLRYGIQWDKINEGRFRQTRLQRLPLDEPAPTILTSRTMYYHPTEHRYLTPREAARLQGFENHFEFAGSITAQFRQIGNAVPPKMAKAIGEELKKLKFKSTHKMKKKPLDHKEVASKAFNYKVS